MSRYVWTERKDMWRRGYYAIAKELMEENYDWELDPMCDCTPARKFLSKTGAWKIVVYKTYIQDEVRMISGKWTPRYWACICSELHASIENLTKDKLDEMWEKLSTEDILPKDIPAYFEEEKLEAEIAKFIP